MGGFLTFNTVRNERIKQSDAGNNKVQIDEVDREQRIAPNTGLAINLHPSSYPNYALQFGIAVGRDNKTPSNTYYGYYLGFGKRFRDLGDHALATFTFGIAATEVNRYPGARQFIGMPLSSDNKIFTPSKEFSIGPYVGISLGFSFGNLEATADVQP